MIKKNQKLIFRLLFWIIPIILSAFFLIIKDRENEYLLFCIFLLVILFLGIFVLIIAYFKDRKKRINKFGNWKIDMDKLVNYKNNKWADEYFIKIPFNDYAIFVYNIVEWRMGWYSGLLAVYANHKKPRLILNSVNIDVFFDDKKTFYFFEQSQMVAFIVYANNPRSSKGGYPFMVLDLENKKFGFVEFEDYISIYYELQEVEKRKVKLLMTHLEELVRKKRFKNRNNEIIDLDKLNWFDFEIFDQAREKYHTEKTVINN